MNQSELKFLVVDDFSTMRRIVRALLKEMGCAHSEEAEGGAVALGMLKSAEFDFVITDVNMPNMNGFELLRAIKADDSLKHLPVLMITAETRREDSVLATQSGAGYVAKPFTRATLEEEIQKVLRRDASTRRPVMSLPSEVLRFILHGQQYALDSAAVQEIRSYQYPEKKHSGTPQWFLGTVSLRGKTLSLVDLRLYAGSPPEINPFTVVLVVEYEDRKIGLIIDQIKDMDPTDNYTLCQMKGDAVSLPLGEYISYTISTPSQYPLFLLDHQKLLRTLRSALTA